MSHVMILAGNVIRSTVTFVPDSGAVAEANVTVEALAPSGAVVAMTADELSANVFEAIATIPENAETGTWIVRWESRAPSPVITATRTFQVV